MGHGIRRLSYQDEPLHACGIEGLPILFLSPVGGGGTRALQFHDGGDIGGSGGANQNKFSDGGKIQTSEASN